MSFVLLMLLSLGTMPVAHITVSDQIPPPIKYPAEVYKMTDDEFFKWATDFNKKQVADVEARRAKITEDKWITGEVTRNDESHVEYSNYGNGYNYRNSYNYSCGPYGCNNYNDAGNSYGSSSQTTTTYPVRWPNPAYYGPGPLTIVNPYCRPTK